MPSGRRRSWALAQVRALPNKRRCFFSSRGRPSTKLREFRYCTCVREVHGIESQTCRGFHWSKYSEMRLPALGWWRSKNHVTALPRTGVGPGKFGSGPLGLLTRTAEPPCRATQALRLESDSAGHSKRAKRGYVMASLAPRRRGFEFPGSLRVCFSFAAFRRLVLVPVPRQPGTRPLRIASNFRRAERAECLPAIAMGTKHGHQLDYLEQTERSIHHHRANG